MAASPDTAFTDGSNATVAITSISVESFALDPERFCEVSWKFRGWSFYDPAKDIQAAREAVRSGFASRSDVVSQTGEDAEDPLHRLLPRHRGAARSAHPL